MTLAADHAGTITVRHERGGRIRHYTLTCACGDWTGAGTTSELADRLLADERLRMADRLRTAHRDHVTDVITATCDRDTTAQPPGARSLHEAWHQVTDDPGLCANPRRVRVS